MFPAAPTQQSQARSLTRGPGLSFARDFGILALALVVFLWGLQYKLSLYKGTSASPIPAAKLLVKRNPVAVSDQANVGATSSPAPAGLLAIAALIALISCLRPASALRLAPARTTRRALTRAGFCRFSFRPPPALA